MEDTREIDTWDGAGDTEKPRSAAIDSASDIPPMRFTGFLPTQLDSLAIDIFKFQLKHHHLFEVKLLLFFFEEKLLLFMISEKWTKNEY